MNVAVGLSTVCVATQVVGAAEDDGLFSATYKFLAEFDKGSAGVEQCDQVSNKMFQGAIPKKMPETGLGSAFGRFKIWAPEAAKGTLTIDELPNQCNGKYTVTIQGATIGSAQQVAPKGTTLAKTTLNGNAIIVETTAQKIDGNFQDLTVTATFTNKDVIDIAANDYVMTEKNEDVTIDVLANDHVQLLGHDVEIEGIYTTDPSHGTVSVDEDNKVTYYPNTGAVGRDSFEYTIETKGTHPDLYHLTAYVDIKIVKPKMGHDPHVTTRNGHRCNIYLTPGLWHFLLTGPTVGIYGRVVALPDDINTQWFDGIAVVAVGGETIFNVTVPHDVKPGFVNDGREGTISYFQAQLEGTTLVDSYATYNSSDAKVSVEARKLSSYANRSPIIYDDKLKVETPDMAFTIVNSRPHVNRINTVRRFSSYAANTRVSQPDVPPVVFLNVDFPRLFPDVVTGPLAEILFAEKKLFSEAAKDMITKKNAYDTTN